MRAPGRPAPQRAPAGPSSGTASASGYRVNVAPKTADAEVEALGAQIVELLGRIRAGEEALAEAEQRAGEAEDIALELEQQLVNATQLAESHAKAAAAAVRPVVPRLDDVDMSPPKAKSAWFPWTLVVLLLGGAAAAFVLVYTPLRASYEAATKQNQDQTAQHAQELSALRNSAAEERSRLESQLAAAQAAAAPAAPTAAAPAAAEPEAHAAKGGHASDAAEARAAKAEEKKAERAAKREERLAKKAEAKAERESKKASKKSSGDEPAAKKPAASGGGGGSDDPLEGM